MKKLSGIIMLVSLLLIPLHASAHIKSKNGNSAQHKIPHLNKQGKTIQLIVDDKPFLTLGGEPGNPSFTSMEYIEPLYARYAWADNPEGANLYNAEGLPASPLESRLN
jgi:hypothetical protein